MRALHIGVDVDDVIFPWYHLAHEASLRAGITNGAEPKSWQPYEEYGCSQQAWFDALEVATLDGSLYRGDLYPGAAEALQRLIDAGHYVHIVTARGFFNHGHLIRQATVHTLKDVPHHSLTFTKDKTIMRLDAFVDDAVHNVQALVAAGIPTWMVNQPHNAGFEYHLRVNHVSEFVDSVLSMGWPAA
jgi:hypothetical protein